MEHRAVVILGAGLSGLSTALHLKGDFIVLEREDRVGGLTRTEEIEGFLFNHTGHWLHLRDERVKRLVFDLLEGRLLTIARKAFIYTHGVFLDYPFQANLYGLPAPILRECLQGAVEAAIRRAGARRPPRLRSFLDYVHYHFGEGIATHFIVPYNTKLFGLSPDEVTAEWTQRFVPIPDIRQIVDGALGYKNEALGYNATFLYPTSGGIEALPRAMAARLPRDKVLLNAPVKAVHLEKRQVEYDGHVITYDYLVSTIPLPELIKCLSDAPSWVKRAGSRLRCSPLRYVNVGLKVERPLRGAHWIYLPERRLPFYRIGSASNAVPGLAPEGCSSLYVELANDRNLSPREVLWALSAFLKEIGTISSDKDVLFAVFREHPYGYVIYDRYCAPSRARLLEFLRGHNIISIGRYGGWTYNSMEDAILDGISAAAFIEEEM